MLATWSKYLRWWKGGLMSRGRHFSRGVQWAQHEDMTGSLPNRVLRRTVVCISSPFECWMGETYSFNQDLVDSVYVNSFKSGLERLHSRKMGFFRDWCPTSPLAARSCNWWSLMFGLMKEDTVLVQPHKVKVDETLKLWSYKRFSTESKEMT